MEELYFFVVDVFFFEKLAGRQGARSILNCDLSDVWRAAIVAARRFRPAPIDFFTPIYMKTVF